MPVVPGGGGKKKSTGNPVTRATSNPFAPRPMRTTAPKDKKIVVKGVTFTVKPDGRIIAPNGQALPKGTTLKTGTVQANGSRKVIGFNAPKGKKIEVKNGTVIVRTGGKTLTERANEAVTGRSAPPREPVRTTVISGKTPTGRSGDDRRAPTGAAPRPTSTATGQRSVAGGGRPPATAPRPAAGMPRSGDDRRPQVPVASTPARPAGRPAAPSGAGGGGVVAGSAGGGFAPQSAGGGGMAPMAAGGGAPAAAPTAAAGRPATTAGTDAEVRRMFGPEMASFLGDKELGPILRKAAAEGWDTSRLLGAVQQTSFWRTKADTERKWVILNRLDNATARRQVEQNAQNIWDLARQQGLNPTGLQVHDLAVNSLKFGWTGAEMREQVFNAVTRGNPGSLATSVATNYGYLAAFLDNPEVGPLLERAAREGWNMQRLEAELQKTNFWKTTSDAQRRFNATMEQSPAEAQQAISARASELLTLAQSLGVQVDPDKLQRIAEDSLRFGWNGSQTRAAITAEFDYQGGESGLAGQSSREIRRMAADYLVPISDQTLEKWTEQIVAGTADMEGFNAYLIEQAKSLFPGMSGALDRGITVAQYTDPYKQLAARELEMSPEAVDLNDPRFRTMLDQVNSKGERVAMTLSESAEYLRKLPEWQQTRGANEKAASLTESILRTFGAVAG